MGNPVLYDNTPVEPDPQEVLGIAVDIGTTTVVAQLLTWRQARCAPCAKGPEPAGDAGALMSSCAWSTRWRVRRRR